MADKIREDFEKWFNENTGFDTFRTNFPMTKPEDQQYLDHNTNLAWLAIAGIFDSLVIKLPAYIKSKPHEYDVNIAHAQGFNKALKLIIEKLDEAGIKYEQY